MSELFREKYRVGSTRLKEWNYGWDGYYFVTICVRRRRKCLSRIVDGGVRLSKIGEVVKDEWLKTKKIRKNVRLDEFVIMPDHFHGIVVIDNHYNCRNVVETHCDASLRGKIKCINKFGPQSNNLASIIRGFKGSVTRRVRKLGFVGFKWQSRFRDRVIRNQKELEHYRGYIRNNPIALQLKMDAQKQLKNKKPYLEAG